MITIALRPIRIIHGDIPKAAFENICKWIELNQDALVEFWNSTEMDSLDIIEKLKPVWGGAKKLLRHPF